MFIPAPRTPADDIADAALHAEVASRFDAAAKAAREQSRFLVTLQTAAGNHAAVFEAAVADLIGQHADAERSAALTAKEAVR